MIRLPRIAAVLPLSLLLACAGGADADGDLLSDNLELLIGTNVEISDSDGDGFTDAEEWLGYFNPLDSEDHPHEGGYYRMPSPLNHPNSDQEIDSSGLDEGDISDNWQLEDRFGELVDLHDYYGQVVLIDMGAEWCGPCRAAGPEAEADYQDLREEGFMVLNLLLDGLTNGAPPDPDRWADDLGLSFPILPDQAMDVATHYIETTDGSFGIPNFSVIGRDMTIEQIYENPAPISTVESLLGDDAPYVEWPLPENAAELREELGIEVHHTDLFFQDNVDLGVELAGSAAASTGGATSTGGESSGGGGFTVSNGDGSYAGPPWGGAACNQSAGSSAGSLALLFGLLSLAGIRRR